MLFQFSSSIGALHHVRLGIVAHGRVYDCRVLQVRATVVSVAPGVGVLPECFFAKILTPTVVKLIVHLVSQVIPQAIRSSSTL